MEKNNSPICIIAPTEKLEKRAVDIVANKEENISVYRTSLDNTPNLARELTEKGTEIIISRRGALKSISHFVNVPLVGIKTMVSDYIIPLQEAKNKNGLIAFFVYGNDIPPEIKPLCEMLNINYKIFSFIDESSCAKQVEIAMVEGAVFGIGGGVSEAYASRFGLEYTVIESSEDTIHSAIESAKQLLAITYREKKKQEELSIRLERYENAFNYTHDAIIAIDDKGIIDVLNEKAKNIIPVKRDQYSGLDIKDVLPTTQMTQVLHSGKKKLNDLMKIGNTYVSTNRLPIIVNNQVKGVVATFQDIKEIQNNEVEIRVRMHEKGLIAKYSFEDIIGSSKPMEYAKRVAKSYANANSTILITGESGTGKELFAHSVHKESKRKSAPFVAINCASIPQNLLESELFGYEEGAFTGALKGGKQGVFELAHKGTIFLDEIGDIPVETQISLLRVIQEKEVRRIGSNKVTPVDIRIITATNKNLLMEVKNGNFREDLYYRLNVLNIAIPPLRDRKDDVETIAMSILYELAGLDFPVYSKKLKDILDICKEYNWPGNVRELHNFIERTYVLLLNQADPDTLLQPAYELVSQEKLVDYSMLQESSSQTLTDTSLEEWEKQIILQCLRRHRLNVTKAAAEIGCSRSTLYRKISKYNISI